MEEKQIIINGHEAVDLGLSVKWATCNIGASKPEDVGEKYRWGEIELPTKGRYRFLDMESRMVDVSIIAKHYPQAYTRKEELGRIHYNISGLDRYDVARHKWGAAWRMPTPDEVNKLMEQCAWEWVGKLGRCGYKITGTTGNSIFLPAREDTIGHLYTSEYIIKRCGNGVEGACFMWVNYGIPHMNITPYGTGLAPIRPVIDK